MSEFKDKKLEEWWNPTNKNNFRGIRLTSQYLMREDFYNISEKEVRNIRSKEENVNRKKLIPLANDFVKDHVTELYMIDSEDEDSQIFLQNLLLDFWEQTTKKKSK